MTKGQFALKAILVALASLFGAIPGLTVLVTGIGTPPGRQEVFGAAVEAFGVLSLLILYVNREKLQGAPKDKITKAAIWCGVGALVCLLVYLTVCSPQCLLKSKRFKQWEEYGTVYFPLWLSGNAKTVIDDSGSRQAALDEFGPGEMESLLSKMPRGNISYMVTDAIFLLLFLGFFTLLTIAFGIAGFHISDRIGGEDEVQDEEEAESDDPNGGE